VEETRATEQTKAMHDTLVISPATLEDAIPMARMTGALIEHGLPRAWSAARIVHHIRRRDSMALVCKSNEQIMGFAVMEFGDESAHLNLLAVSTLGRRRKIGTRLLEWLHETAITSGTFIVHLELRASNYTALKFYRAMGYREDEIRYRYYAGREDAISMVQNLAVDTSANDAPYPTYWTYQPR
jgi:ribosomal protein S18 acetylase RimI-like enzyme